MTPEQYQSLIDESNRWNFLEKAVEAIRMDAISQQVRSTRRHFEEGDPHGVKVDASGEFPGNAPGDASGDEPGAAPGTAPGIAPGTTSTLYVLRK